MRGLKDKEAAYSLLFSRDRVLETPQPHKLVYGGSNPSPASKFQCGAMAAHLTVNQNVTSSNLVTGAS